ncbi:glycine dehydrogenase (decarboxylating) alpha subunit [Hydrogenispora ethanolica]|uniref:Probable glycine dehydrogenase (decarboxylating) subunit 1 n=1 Tax=Hydrogenispora ethanolica TaxID=1082276 RepID=A0A4R1S9Z0_HYDET|nr:aminomethyl-transferring glycine dehydrogenase subunit GcvPA [Hydrogenispora ethanolica]TCL76313.1 glycine dehydrogenase (decarboxylating) alpha subunit [Hydrogenispora ethanolica]
MNHPYLPLTDGQRRAMLDTIGVSDFAELLAEVPEELRLKKPLDLPASQSELELSTGFHQLAEMNVLPELSFLGAGAYQHYIPAVVNHLAKRSEFYTAYTPYQPELSQGMLQAIFEFQSYISELFGLPVANASLYDGPTALAEAVLMALKETRRNQVLLPETLHPSLIEVVRTYLRDSGVEIIILPCPAGVQEIEHLAKSLSEECAAVVIQNPNRYGILEDLSRLIELTRQAGAVPISYVQPLTLGLLEAPGRLGAEIVVGEGQPLGLPLSYGGPYLGLMAVSERFMRRIPGRLVGETLDRDGRISYVLTLQAREQHIRREKATSNICSNQALCALRAAIYLGVLGPKGLHQVAQRCYDNAHYLAAELNKAGFPLRFEQPFFMEFAIHTSRPAADLIHSLAARGIMPGLDLGRFDPALDHSLLVCATEIFSKTQLDRFCTEMRDLG